MNAPCYYSMAADEYADQEGQAQEREIYIERIVDGYMDLTARELWARLADADGPESDELAGRFGDLLAELAELSI